MHFEIVTGWLQTLLNEECIHMDSVVMLVRTCPRCLKMSILHSQTVSHLIYCKGEQSAHIDNSAEELTTALSKLAVRLGA